MSKHHYRVITSHCLCQKNY